MAGTFAEVEALPSVTGTFNMTSRSRPTILIPERLVARRPEFCKVLTASLRAEEATLLAISCGWAGGMLGARMAVVSEGIEAVGIEATGIGATEIGATGIEATFGFVLLS